MFAPNANAATGTTTNVGQNDNWKSQGFINIYLPTLDGGKIKLGSIGLKENKPREKALLDALKENEEGTLFALATKAIFEFNAAEPTDNKGFDLGLVMTPKAAAPVAP